MTFKRFKCKQCDKRVPRIEPRLSGCPQLRATAQITRLYRASVVSTV